jgi:hypothetical protein
MEEIKNVFERKVSTLEFYNSYSYFRSECFDLRAQEEYLENSVIDSINLPPENFELKIKLNLITYLISDSPFDVHPIHVFADQKNESNLNLFVSETKKFLSRKSERKYEILILGSFKDFSTDYSILCSKKKIIGENLYDDLNKIIFNCLPQRILNNLFLGDFKTSQSQLILNHFKIDSIVNASNVDYPSKFKDKEYLLVTIDDNDHSDIIDWFEKVINFIENKKLLGINCLVHW